MALFVGVTEAITDDLEIRGSKLTVGDIIYPAVAGTSGHVLTLGSDGRTIIFEELDYNSISNTPTIGDGTLTITDIDGNVVGTFTANQEGDTTVNLPKGFSGDYDDLTNKPTIGDGTLTIRDSDGNTVETFTANQDGDTTVDLPKEFSGSYNDLTNKPPIGDGTLTIKDSDGNTIETFTANQDGDTTVDLPKGFSGDYDDLTNKPTNIVEKITAGAGISVTPNTGIGQVTITNTAESLTFGGAVNVTSDVIPSSPFTRSDGTPLTISDFYVNVGLGKFSATWAGITINANTNTDANPGDYIVYNGTNFEHVASGTPPGSDGLWVSGGGQLTPVDLSDTVAIGQTAGSISLDITGKAVSDATVSGDGGTTLTTKGYVDGLIPTVGNGALEIKSYQHGASATGSFNANNTTTGTLTLPQIRYQDISGTPAIPTVGSGPLTIRTFGQNAAASGSFNANSDSASTLTLPQIRYQDISGTPAIPTVGAGPLTIRSFGENAAATGSFNANSTGASTLTLPQIRYQDITGTPDVNEAFDYMEGVYSILDPIFGGEFGGSWSRAFNHALQGTVQTGTYYNGEISVLLVPAGEYKCLTYVKRTKVVKMIGDGFGASKIVMGNAAPHTMNIDATTAKGQFVLANKGIVRGIGFEGIIKDNTSNPTGDHSVVLCFRGFDNDGVPFGLVRGNQNDSADMDQPLIDCAFKSNGGGGDTDAALKYVGRNAYIFGCSFNTNGTALHLTFPNKPGNTTAGESCIDNDSLLNASQGGIYGWRRCQVIGCYFHLTASSDCIVARGPYQCRGLIIANNLADIGGRLFKFIPNLPISGNYSNGIGGGLSQLVISGNTALNNEGKNAVIQLTGSNGLGTYDNCSITGNAFAGSDNSYDESPCKDTPGFESKIRRCFRGIDISAGSVVNGLSITGNSFAYFEKQGIKIGATSTGTKKGVSITGNNFLNCGLDGTDYVIDCDVSVGGVCMGNSYVKTDSNATDLFIRGSNLVGRDDSNYPLP